RQSKRSVQLFPSRHFPKRARLLSGFPLLFRFLPLFRRPRRFQRRSFLRFLFPNRFPRQKPAKRLPPRLRSWESAASFFRPRKPPVRQRQGSRFALPEALPLAGFPKPPRTLPPSGTGHPAAPPIL